MALCHILRMRALLLAMMCLAGCASTPQPNATMDTETTSFDATELSLLEDYVIGVGDTISVNVWRNPELSAQMSVLPDGTISVPLAGNVKAAGVTTESLAAQISEQLNNFIRQPEVTVSVLNAVSAQYLQRVRITGAVGSPLSINFSRGLTVMDLVLMAGGLSPFANANKALLYRREDSELKVYPVRLEDILLKGRLETNYTLLPSDIITVPEKSF